LTFFLLGTDGGLSGSINLQHLSSCQGIEKDLRELVSVIQGGQAFFRQHVNQVIY